MIDDISARKAAAIASSGSGRVVGKRIVVTGATGHIGGCICKKLAAEGADIIAVGRNKEKLEKLILESRAQGYNFTECIMDVTDENSIKEAFSRIDDIDVLVNCAGGSAREKWSEIIRQDDDVIKSVLATNLNGVIFCCKYAAQKMAAKNKGCIINIASTIGVGGKAGYSEYAAAKAGEIGFTRSFALEVGKYNINVNCVTPGIVDRTLSEDKLPRIAKTNAMNSVGIDNDIAYAVLFLASDEAKFITGQNIIVDGGRSLGLKGD